MQARGRHRRYSWFRLETEGRFLSPAEAQCGSQAMGMEPARTSRGTRLRELESPAPPEGWLFRQRRWVLEGFRGPAGRVHSWVE